MGNAASGGDGEDDDPSSPDRQRGRAEGDDPYDPFDGIDTLGYRVLGVQPNSPAAAAGLVSFLDFLVGANRRMLLGSGEGLEDGEEYDDIDLPALLEENKGKPVEFLVFNIKSQESRLLELVPSDTWGGAGLLGVTIRLDDYAGAEDRLIRVLEVEDHSPAAVAGLVPYKDYLLGTTTVSLDSSETLAALLRSHEDRVVELYVYNVDSDVVRVVALMPTLSWGGRGLLGAAVGTGYLHRLPSHARHTEGASVQRKVRYVGVATPSAGGGTSTTPGGDNAPATTVIPTLGSSRTIVELVPQMEMEHDDEDEDDEDGSDPGPDASEELSSVALSVDEISSSTAASPRGGAAGATHPVSARGVPVETIAADCHDDDNDARPEDRAPKRPVREASGRHWEDAGRGVGGGGTAPAAAERRDRPPTQPSDPPTIPEVHTLGALESRKRRGSADELFALPEAPASPVPPSPPPPGVRQPSTSSRYNMSPTSYTNALPPPPKMHYHA